MSLSVCSSRGAQPVKAAHSRSKKGFTLTEIAIVLGIIGLILGAIWVAAASVYSNLRVSKSTTQLLSVTQAVRSLYATSSSTGEVGFVDLTTQMITAGVFPTDMVSGTTAVDAWNGQVKVASQKASTDGDSFLVQFAAVPSSACISLLTSTTGAGRDSGLLYAAAAAAASAASITTTTAFPITASQAATACGTNNANPVVQWVFKLKG